MGVKWHDINDPGWFRNDNEKDEDVDVVELQEFQAQPQKNEPEVRFVQTTWKEGPEGFQFNKKCVLEVKAEFLKETVRKRITGNLFVVYEGQEENLNLFAEGTLDKNGIAHLEFTLYYSDRYYDALRQNPSATCVYKVKDIKHSSSIKAIESVELEMPYSQKNLFCIRLNVDPADPDMQKFKYSLYSTDQKKTYDKILTVKDDKKPGDSYLDLEFSGIDKNLRYTLHVDSGEDGEGFVLFEDASLDNV